MRNEKANAVKCKSKIGGCTTRKKTQIKKKGFNRYLVLSEVQANTEQFYNTRILRKFKKDIFRFSPCGSGFNSHNSPLESLNISFSQKTSFLILFSWKNQSSWSTHISDLPVVLDADGIRVLLIYRPVRVETGVL